MSLLKNRISVIFIDPDESLENPYSVFTEDFDINNDSRHINAIFIFNTPEELIKFHQRVTNDEEGPYGMWYWVLDHGECICSGAVDPDDIEIFNRHWSLKQYE